MKPGITLLAALLVSTGGFTQAFAQDVISVDAGAVVADTSRRQIGVNTNYLVDDDANRASALRGLADALREAGVKYLSTPEVKSQTGCSGRCGRTRHRYRRWRDGRRRIPRMSSGPPAIRRSCAGTATLSRSTR